MPCADDAAGAGETARLNDAAGTRDAGGTREAAGPAQTNANSTMGDSTLPPRQRSAIPPQTSAKMRQAPPVAPLILAEPTTMVAPDGGTSERLARFSSPQRPAGSQR